MIKTMEKFKVTLTETDKGIEISFIDFETKRKADLGIINPLTEMGKLCKIIIEQTQVALSIADLVIPNEK